MYMKKDKILKFLELILNNASTNNIITDTVSLSNYKQINEVIKGIDLVHFKDFKYIIEKSENNIKEDFIVKPEEKWDVHKEYDEFGNLIKYDSIYSWSYSNVNQESYFLLCYYW